MSPASGRPAGAAAAPSASTGAILLAGGRANRMGGVTKPLLEVGGRALLHRAVDAVAGCRPVTIVADVLDPGIAGVSWTREDPPFSGPAAGVAAALSSWPVTGEPAWTFVLACDLARPDAVVETLRAARTALPAASDGVHLVDETGRPQWLAGLYRTSVLRARLDRMPGRARDRPMRALLGGLASTAVESPAAATLDIDTWEDLERARTHAASQEER